MKPTDREIVTAKETITMYLKLKNKSFIDIDDFFFLAENASNSIGFILSSYNVTISDFREALKVNKTITLVQLFIGFNFCFWFLKSAQGDNA